MSTSIFARFARNLWASSWAKRERPLNECAQSLSNSNGGSLHQGSTLQANSIAGNSHQGSILHPNSHPGSIVKDVLTVGSEVGFHDPEHRSFTAPICEPPTFTEVSEVRTFASDVSMADDVDEDMYFHVFELRKKRMGLGFAPAWSGAVLLANTLLGGSGLLGIPHAFSVAGWVLGVGLIILFGSFSAFGCHLLACSARRVCRTPCSFYAVSHAVVPRWTWLVDSAVAIKCFGVATSYLIIIGDLLPEAMAGFGLYHERWLFILIGWGIGGSLAMMKTLSALRYTSMLALAISLWTSILVALFYFRVGNEFDPCPKYVGRLPCNGAVFDEVGHNYLALAKGLPVFIFGFTCQQNVFTICNEVAAASNRRINAIIVSSYLPSACAFGLVALLGQWTYGDQVQSNVLKDYSSNIVVNFTKVACSLLVTFSYPLQIHPSRASWLALWRLACPSGPAADQSRWDDTQRRVESFRFMAITIFLIFGTLAIAIPVTDLGSILGVVGATGSTTVSYILPGLVYFATFKKWTAKRAAALIQLCLGLIIMPTCLIVTFIP